MFLQPSCACMIQFGTMRPLPPPPPHHHHHMAPSVSHLQQLGAVPLPKPECVHRNVLPKGCLHACSTQHRLTDRENE